MKKIIVCLLLLLLTVGNSTLLYAHEGYDVSIGGIEDIDKQIQELKQKITDAQNKEKTLSSEIKTMDSKIKLTTLQMTETAELIGTLGKEISQLGTKIGTLESELSRLSEILIDRIATSYKIQRISYLPLLFSAHGLTDLLTRAKYIQLAQAHDRQVLTDVQFTKDTYTEQKQLREAKKAQQEVLIKQLEIQRNQLADQKKTKQSLLDQTKNDEATYQRLLSQALAEKQAIEAALVSGVQVGPVKKGDPIALVGNTGYPGCSTGAHLHFEIRKNNQWTDPGSYLSSRTVIDQQNGGTWTTGSGDWDWPLTGDVVITQHYGQTPYSWRYAYSGGVHTGYDMISNSSSIIRAPKDGTLYSSSQTCGSSSIIKIKYIDHGDSTVSFYLHVQ